MLPEDARGHNRSLVLQKLYRKPAQSRADLARSTGLTRVTVADLVSDLMDQGLVREVGQRVDPRPGKPATLLEMDRGSFQIIGVDLSDLERFRGGVLDLDGTVITEHSVVAGSRTDGDATAQVLALLEILVSAATAPLLGLGVGAPGIVDLDGVVLAARHLGWSGEDLQAILTSRFGLPVIVVNDANAALLAEHSFGSAAQDMLLIKVGLGVGASLLLDGRPLVGSRYVAGEIGHVVVGTDGGDLCECGKRGCLATWVAVPRIRARIDDLAPGTTPEVVLAEAGMRLGVALAPLVGALDLAEIVLCGPTDLLAGVLAASALSTIQDRTLREVHGDVTLRLTALGPDIVILGAAAMVLSAELGVS